MFYKCKCGQELYIPSEDGAVFRSRMISHMSCKKHLKWMCVTGKTLEDIKDEAVQYQMSQSKFNFISSSFTELLEKNNFQKVPKSQNKSKNYLEKRKKIAEFRKSLEDDLEDDLEDS